MKKKNPVKTTSVILITANIVFILALCEAAFDTLENISYSLHELISGFANVCMVVIPIVFIALITLLLRYKKETADFTKATKALTTVSFIICLLSAFTYIVFINGYNSSAYVKNVEKFTENGKYYVTCFGRDISVTEEQYNQIKDGESYEIHYKGNKLFDTYRMKSITDENGTKF